MRQLWTAGLIAAAALHGARGAAAQHGAQGALERAPIATWVWDDDVVRVRERRDALLQFARDRGVDGLYVHVSSREIRPDALAAFCDLVADARARDIEVMAVAGDPSWALREKHAHALGVIERVAEINARLRERGLPPIARVLFDVEPYLLPSWRRPDANVSGQYIALLEALQAAGRARTVEVWHTIPFWFARRSYDAQPLDRWVLDRSDGAVVMAYRRNARDVRRLALPTLTRAAELERKVIVAVETRCVEPAHVTFCRAAPGELAAALGELDASLRPYPAFAGLAVHQYRSWRALDEGGY